MPESGDGFGQKLLPLLDVLLALSECGHESASELVVMVGRVRHGDLHVPLGPPAERTQPARQLADVIELHESAGVLVATKERRGSLEIEAAL